MRWLFFGLVFGLPNENETTMRVLSEPNAGSMADIAFLLLIFFMVATTMNGEKGIQRRLPAPEQIGTALHPKRNTLVILINNQNKIMVGEQIVDFVQLHSEIRKFVLNNGDGTCDYCFDSSKSHNSSDNPREALVALDVQTETSYEIYVAVQNEVSSVYNELRNELSDKQYGVDYKGLKRVQRRAVKAKFPLLLSENVLRLN